MSEPVLPSVSIHSMVPADHVEVVNGKLYMMGGGFGVIGEALPAQIGFSLAFMLEVPWDLTNTEHSMRVELLDADGQPAGFETEVRFNVGRAVDARPGMPLMMPAAMPVRVMFERPGLYELRAQVGSNEPKRVLFELRDTSAG